jgi:glycopeptide antibiotics resistance protein
LKSKQVEILFALYLISLSAIVFTPVDPNSDGLFGVIQISGPTERFLNLFLLVPLAILTKISYNQFSLRTIVIICTCTSAGIEVIQTLIPGRVSDLVDVFTNSFGAGCGLLVFWRFTQKRSTHR